MDYGKLAYLKAIDLEDRLNIRRTNFGVINAKYDSVPGGNVSVCTIEGSGDIAVLFKSTASVVIYANGARICEGTSGFFKLDGSSTISVESSDGTSLELLAIGNVLVSDGSTGLNADCYGGYVAFVLPTAGRAAGYIAYINSFSPYVAYDGEFVKGDVCECENGFLFAFVTTDGKISLCLNGESRECSANADSVAISADSHGIVGACINKGELYAFELNDFNADLRPYKLEYNGIVDDIKFVKKSRKLLFSSGGKCFVKELAPNIRANMSITAKISAEVI